MDISQSASHENYLPYLINEVKQTSAIWYNVIVYGATLIHSAKD